MFEIDSKMRQLHQVLDCIWKTTIFIACKMGSESRSSVQTTMKISASLEGKSIFLLSHYKVWIFLFYENGRWHCRWNFLRILALILGNRKSCDNKCWRYMNGKTLTHCFWINIWRYSAMRWRWSCQMFANSIVTKYTGKSHLIGLKKEKNKMLNVDRLTFYCKNKIYSIQTEIKIRQIKKKFSK